MDLPFAYPLLTLRSQAANGSLWGKARVGVAGTIEAQPIFPGSQVDFGTRIGMQEQAAATLAELAFHDPILQDAIIEAGGVPPLLNLVKVQHRRLLKATEGSSSALTEIRSPLPPPRRSPAALPCRPLPVPP